MKVKVNKNSFFIAACMTYISCLLTSNVLATKVFQFTSSVTLPSAVIIFPVVYILNDLMAEVYGYSKVKKVVFAGFALNLMVVIAQQIAILLPSASFATETGEAFSTVLSSTPRMLVASLLAYIVGSLCNAKIMQFMKEKLEKYLMLRCILSTVVGEGLDACIFITIAFVGTMPVGALLTMIVAQALFKTLFEVVLYPVTRIVIRKVKEIPEV